MFIYGSVKGNIVIWDLTGSNGEINYEAQKRKGRGLFFMERVRKKTKKPRVTTACFRDSIRDISNNKRLC